MGVLLSYDVGSKHAEVKAQLKTLNYHDSWASEGTTYYLPNTTLWKESGTQAQAMADIKTVCAKLAVPLQRAVAVPSSPWGAIPGEPHSK